MKKQVYVTVLLLLSFSLLVSGVYADTEDTSQGTAHVGPVEGGPGGAMRLTFNLLVHSRPNVDVKVYETDGTLVANASTDEDGAVEFELESGKYYVEATFLGQKVYSEWFYLRNDEAVTLKFNVWMVMKGLLLLYWKLIVAVILLIVVGVWLLRHRGEKKPGYIPKLP